MVGTRGRRREIARHHSSRSQRRLLAFATALALGGARYAAAQPVPPPLTITADSSAIRPGDVVRLDVACACAAARAGSARVFNREVPLVAGSGPAAWSALIGIDVETAPGRYPVQVALESTAAQPLRGSYTLTVVARQFPTRRLKVAPVYVDPPPAEQARIAADAKRLNAIYAAHSLREQVGPFQAPVRIAAQNTFGARSIFNGQPRSLHAGVDFSSPAGAPIAAPAAGVVVLADDLFFTGRTIVLDHGRGLYSILAHLSKMAVGEGDVVKIGDVVGLVGATGRATGPHLHWSARLNGARVDPMVLLKVLPVR
jgi:murein DD-endopeptidase MepM/ murein hydrolase activator NlpD